MFLPRQEGPWLVLAILFSHSVIQTLSCNDCCGKYTEDYECVPKSVGSENNFLLGLYEDTECTNDPVETTLKLLEGGDELIQLTDEAIMLIGNTGTGKSTLTYFLAGDNSKLIAYEKATDWFLIKDCNGKIGSGGSGIVSATIFPDLVIEPVTNTSYYDNPGFMDTRSVCIEIANAYFMKKVADNLTKVKFAMVTNYASLIPGMSRDDFTGMLKNVINFVPNIEKYGRALAIIGTKLVTSKPFDDPYISDVISFLTNLRPDLDQVFAGDQLRKAEYIVDALREGSGGKIGVFRAPDECGPVDGIESMQTNKQNIYEVVMNGLEFVDSSPKDFNFSISAEAKISVLDIAAILNLKILTSIHSFRDQLDTFIASQFDGIEATGIIASVEKLFQNPDFASDYADEGQWLGLTFSQVIQRLTNPDFVPPGVNISVETSKALERDSRYLDFLQEFTNVGVNVLNWLQPMKELRSKVLYWIATSTAVVDQDIIHILQDEVRVKIENWFVQNLDEMSSRRQINISQFSTSLQNLMTSSYNLSSTVDNLKPTVYMNEILTNVNSFGGAVEDLTENLERLQTHAFLLDFFKQVIDGPIGIRPKYWIEPLMQLDDFVIHYFRSIFVPKIHLSIFNKLGEQSDELRDHIGLMTEPLHDVYEMKKLLDKYSTKLKEINNQINTLLTQDGTRLLDFLHYLDDSLVALQVITRDVRKEDGWTTEFRDLVLNLVEMVGDFEWIPAHEWRKPFAKLATFVESEVYWNSFRIRIDEDLAVVKTKVATLEGSYSSLQKNPVPIGFVYVQLPKEPAPDVIWPGVTWRQVTSDYAGLFFRAEGSGSAGWNSIQSGDSPHLTSVYAGTANSQNLPVLKTVTPGFWSGFIPTGEEDRCCTALGLEFLVSNVETRPRNMAMRIWKRSA